MSFCFGFSLGWSSAGGPGRIARVAQGRRSQRRRQYGGQSSSAELRSLLYLSLDQPSENTFGEASLALGRWSRRGYHLQTYGAMFGTVECHLYLGNYAEAKKCLLDDWDRMSSSFILRWQTLRIMALFLRGRVALANWFEQPKDQSRRRDVVQTAARLNRIRSPWSSPMATALYGGVAAGDGRRAEAASQLEMAAAGFEQISLDAYASAARHFSGRLHGGRHGQELMNTAAEFLRRQQVLNPPAFLDMLLPGSAFRTFASR